MRSNQEFRSLDLTPFLFPLSKMILAVIVLSVLVYLIFFR
jgi:hypothetical protein